MTDDEPGVGGGFRRRAAAMRSTRPRARCRSASVAATRTTPCTGRSSWPTPATRAYVWRRLLVITSEDVGLAEPTMPATIHALHQAALTLEAAQAEGLRPAAARPRRPAPQRERRKSRIVDHALIAFTADETVRPVPDVAIDKHTKRGRAMGRGREHFFEEGSLLANVETGELEHEPHLPDPYRERAAPRYSGAGTPKPEPKSDDDRGERAMNRAEAEPPGTSGSAPRSSANTAGTSALTASGSRRRSPSAAGLCTPSTTTAASRATTRRGRGSRRCSPRPASSTC